MFTIAKLMSEKGFSKLFAISWTNPLGMFYEPAGFAIRSYHDVITVLRAEPGPIN